jgi:uncharacterized protein (DUF2126 family)
MKIDTNDWLPLAEAVVQTGIPQKTLYRIADRLGLAVDVFGVRVVRKSDLPKLVAGRMPAGNPDWIGDYEKASEAAAKATASRMRRIAEHGLTKSEKKRLRMLPKIGAASGGRPPRARQPEAG